MKKYLFFNLLLFLAFQMAGQSAQTDYAKMIRQYREDYKKDFLADKRSPLQTKKQVKNLRFFKPDEHYRVLCTFERTPDEQPFELPTFSGSTKPYVKYGVLTFDLDGQLHRLAVYQNLALREMPEYAQYLFLPFRDLTNGEETYGGGRYLDLQISDFEGGQVTLDFNKSYNPWCAYSDNYVCPIPPPENSLELAVEAGEKMWIGKESAR